jgi:radical SAM superfamily enzyme YgiQ (UPF0313 family)
VDEQTFPIFLEDLGKGEPGDRYTSTSGRTLVGVPPIRRDLIQRALHLVPSSIVVSRGSPDRCGFCYRDSIFTGGKGQYTQVVDDVLAEIEPLPGEHPYFLDDYILGNPRFARGLLDGMRGMRRLSHGAATVASIVKVDLVKRAVDTGLPSIFMGFETLDEAT